MCYNWCHKILCKEIWQRWCHGDVSSWGRTLTGWRTMGSEWDKGEGVGWGCLTHSAVDLGGKGHPIGNVSNYALVIYWFKVNCHKFSSVSQHLLTTPQFCPQKYGKTQPGSLLQVPPSQGTQVSASLGSDVEAQEKNLLLSLVIKLAEFSSCGYRTELPVSLLVVTWGAVLCSALIL